MSEYQSDSIFWVEVDRISPNPYQPRKEFDQVKLTGLADSIRQYGIMQPLVVTKREQEKEDGGLSVNYELIAGERRLRGAKIAGLQQVPVIIRNDEESNQMKLELAIIENLQREDLNAIDRALAFDQLAREFKFKHAQIAMKVGKSREYVSNSMRLLGLPPIMQDSMRAGNISEGHGRPLLMLNDRPEEQMTLFKEITAKKLTVRETESIARRIAVEKIRKKARAYDPEIINLEQQLTESLGTRVQIESREVGGKIVIDFFSNDDLRNLLETLNKEREKSEHENLTRIMSEDTVVGAATDVKDGEVEIPKEHVSIKETPMSAEEVRLLQEDVPIKEIQETTITEKEEKDEGEDDDLYSIKNFSV